MRFFHNDYNEICHPAVMNKMQQISSLQMDGYGEDPCCVHAAGMIRNLCKNDDLAVHFLAGGTQANLTVIAAALRPHQAALGAESAHIQVHETGAIEATGHKVLSLLSKDGKITSSQIRSVMELHNSDGSREHIAQPKLVYISHPTELGTTYQLNELEDIAAVCREYGLYLYVDGARLGYALAANDADVQLSDLARVSDVFYIGGTKVGAMFGEAVVISNPAIAEDFRYIIKQRGGMLAKGWLLGAQFEALLEDNLYFEISQHANQLADRIRNTLTSCGHKLMVSSRTNQVFAVLPDYMLDRIRSDFSYSMWERVDAEHCIVRFCTSWATKPADVDALCAAIKKYSE